MRERENFASTKESSKVSIGFVWGKQAAYLVVLNAKIGVESALFHLEWEHGSFFLPSFFLSFFSFLFFSFLFNISINMVKMHT
jgi:hypothetical protein